MPQPSPRDLTEAGGWQLVRPNVTPRAAGVAQPRTGGWRQRAARRGDESDKLDGGARAGGGSALRAGRRAHAEALDGALAAAESIQVHTHTQQQAREQAGIYRAGHPFMTAARAGQTLDTAEAMRPRLEDLLVPGLTLGGSGLLPPADLPARFEFTYED